MFIGLLSACKIGSFGKLLDFNSKGPIKCVSLNNQLCQARPTLVNINFNQPHFYPLTVTANKCSESCNAIDDRYAQIWVPNKVKSMNLEVFNLMSNVNEARFLVQHKLCKCKCGLNESIYNTKHGIIMNVGVSVKN